MNGAESLRKKDLGRLDQPLASANLHIGNTHMLRMKAWNISLGYNENYEHLRCSKGSKARFLCLSSFRWNSWSDVCAWEIMHEKQTELGKQ